MNSPTPIPLDLAPFCSTDQSRYSLRSPWSDGDHTFATDAKIMIAVPRRADVPEREDAPKNCWRHIIEGWPSDGQFRPLPPIPPAENEPCANCTNGIANDRQCPDCKGTKQVRCGECDQWRDCRECNSTGTLKNTAGDRCTKCDGHGNTAKLKTVEIGSQLVNATLLRRIQHLPNVAITNSTVREGALSFRFDGGEGRIMPMHK
jgi:hypothetical protein